MADVAGHDAPGRDHDLLPAANDAGLARKHALERIGGLFGISLLVDADPRVETDDGEDERHLEPGGEFGVGVVGDEGLDDGDGGDGDEHVDEHVVHLGPDALQERLLGFFGHLVGAVFGKARRCLVVAQAGFDVVVLQAEMLDRLLDGHGVPWRC